MLYLDHNATTPLDPRVMDAMLPYLQRHYGNASALHRAGRLARSAVDQARQQLALLIDADPAQVVFTSGGTESNATALHQHTNQRVFASAIEHPSLTENLPEYATYLPVTSDGLADLAFWHALDWQSGDWVGLMLANNETGALQPVAELSAHLSGRGVWLHCDAVQAVGKVPVSFRQLGVQSMSVSSHKLYGPKGCGALILAEPATAKPLLAGGGQEQNLRGGTENVAAIVGFGKAAELAQQELQSRMILMSELRLRLEQQLQSLPGVTVFAENAPRLPNTLQFGLTDQLGEMLVMQLDARNIAVSSGSACAAGSEQISSVLAAMGVDAKLARAAIRVSFGMSNTLEDVDRFVAELKAICGI